VSLGEIVLLLLVGIIVVGPRNLPTMMRTAGQWIARLRRMSTELRSQSGIDDLLRREGLDEHLHSLRSLSRLNVVDTLMAPAAAAVAPPAARTPAMYPSAKSMEWKQDAPLREREYPLTGCDAGGVLPDDATPYLPPPAAIADDAPPAAVEPAEAAKAETAEAAKAETAEAAKIEPAEAAKIEPAEAAKVEPAETAKVEPVEAAPTETAAGAPAPATPTSTEAPT
jgi:sec-independent protein translocase protein TatB